MAKIEGYPPVIFDGTNADDDMQERAGSRAIAELGIISPPLKELGIGKDEILSEVVSLPVVFHNDSCKATRLTKPLDDSRMDIVEMIEDKLRDRFSGIRYRIDDEHIVFIQPTKLYEKDFRYINEVKRQIR